MAAMLRVIFADFWGLRRVGGFALAVRWLFAIVFNFRQCRAERNLQPADRAMGEGPFAVRMDDARARVIGPQVLSGVREIWVRDVYLQRGLLTMPTQGTVVDLGANMGNFTLLALAQGPGSTRRQRRSRRPQSATLTTPDRSQRLDGSRHHLPPFHRRPNASAGGLAAPRRRVRGTDIFDRGRVHPPPRASPDRLPQMRYRRQRCSIFSSPAARCSR